MSNKPEEASAGWRLPAEMVHDTFHILYRLMPTFSMPFNFAF